MNEELAKKYQESQRLLRHAAEEVEWVSEPGTDGRLVWCPWCLNDTYDGHRKDCLRQVALGIVDEQATT